jgi:hypothetical protein
MRSIRRAGSAAVAFLLLSAASTGSASAATTTTPETYVGSAAGRALSLSVGPSSVTLGSSLAKVDSTLKAAADSAGVLGLPVVGGSNAGAVEVTGADQSKATGEKCATPAFPAPLAAVLNFGAGCSSSLAEVKGDDPRALATGTVAKLDLSAQTLLATPLNALQPVTTPLLGGIDTINKTLPVDLKVDDTLGDLLKALGSTKTLEVELGKSISEVATTDGVVTSTATSQAGRIAILPLGAVAGVELKPVVEIIVGQAKATAVYDRVSGESKPSFDPAIVTIRINTPTTDSLGKLIGQNLSEIKIAPNLALPAAGPLAAPCADAKNEYCVLPGTPFETAIAIASGRTVQNADGTVGAVADAVKIHALRNIGTLVAPLTGGIKLELAHAEAGVGGRPAETVTIDIPAELPRTGGTPWIPMAGAGVLGLAILARRTVVRSN